MAKAIVVCLALVFSFIPVESGSQYRENYCNGDEIDAACPVGSVIKLTEAWYVFVHRVWAAEDCRQHFDATTLCAHKIQFAHQDAHENIYDNCEGRQKCIPMRANTTIQVVCHPRSVSGPPDPPSPPEYVQIAYNCTLLAPQVDPPSVITVLPPFRTSRQSASMATSTRNPSSSSAPSVSPAQNRTSPGLYTTSTSSPPANYTTSTSSPSSSASNASRPASNLTISNTASTLTTSTPGQHSTTPGVGNMSSPTFSTTTVRPSTSTSQSAPKSKTPHNGSTSTVKTTTVAADDGQKSFPSTPFSTTSSKGPTHSSYQSSTSPATISSSSQQPSSTSSSSPGYHSTTTGRVTHSSPKPIIHTSGVPTTTGTIATTRNIFAPTRFSTTPKHFFSVTITRSTTTGPSTFRHRTTMERTDRTSTTTQDPLAGGLHLKLSHQSLAMLVAVPISAIVILVILLAAIIICTKRKRDVKASRMQDDAINRVVFYPGNQDSAQVATALDSSPMYGLETKVRIPALTEPQSDYQFSNPQARLAGIGGPVGLGASARRDLRVTLRELEESAKNDDDFSTMDTSVGVLGRYEPLPEQAYTEGQ